MATARNNTSKAAAAATDLPYAWGIDGEELETRILVDKEALLEIPFKIIGFEVERNDKRGYDTAFIYALDRDGNEFCFADTTDTGVKGQLQKAAAERGLNPAAGAGFVRLPLIILGGLRVSEYDAPEGSRNPGRARTFYLVGKATKHG